MEAYFQYRRLTKSAATEVNRSPQQNSTSSLDRLTETKGEDFDVTFQEGDGQNPRSWSKSWKLSYTSIIWLLVFVTGWASAADSTYHDIANGDLHVSEVAESLATANYLFGVAVGSVFAGPCSETVGRLGTYLATFVLYMVWVMATALSPNFGAQITFRFMAGLCASASMSIYGGSLADLYELQEREIIWPFFALSPLLGPTVAPVVSGWIAEKLGWRWVDWVTLVISGVAFLLAASCLPETYSPIILSFKAAALRKDTGDTRYQSTYDKQTGFSALLVANLRRIAHFIVRELTTVVFGLYLTLLYMLVFGFLEGFDYIFSDTYGFDVGQRYTSFSAIAIGIVLGLPYMLMFNYLARRPGHNAEPAPEQKLLPMIVPAPILAGCLFWIGWTNRVDISYWSDLSACCVFGFSVMALFTSTYHYLLDCYGVDAASAMGAATFMRYMASGGMVMITEPMYERLGVEWTMTLLGSIAAILSPLPLVFWYYGRTIRKRSRWATSEEST